MGGLCVDINNIHNRFLCRENGVTMHRVIQVTEDVYNRLKPKTNSLGGRDPRKVGFSEVIKQALDDQDRLKKRKISK